MVGGGRMGWWSRSRAWAWAWTRACVVALLLAPGCGAPSARGPAKPAASSGDSGRIGAVAFPEGDALFHQDRRWVGADSAYSIDLGAGRVLWLFADTFVDPAADGVRTNGPNWFARNSVAIQHARAGAPAESGYDPTRAAMRFGWRRAPDGAARSFFADVDEAGHWVWPLHGARLPGGLLLLFRMHVYAVTGGLGFTLGGWDAVLIQDPDAPIEVWQPRVVVPETHTHDVLLGAAVMLHEGWLYAYAVRNDDRAHAVYVARVTLAELAREPEGALADPEWHCGARGWVRQSAGAEPAPLFEDGQTELSVHFNPRTRHFLLIQMQGLWLSERTTGIAYRSAFAPEGPWSTPSVLYRPPEAKRPDVAQLVAYAGKAHPEQRGPDGALVLSYVAHHLGAAVPPDAVYWPRLAYMR